MPATPRSTLTSLCLLGLCALLLPTLAQAVDLPKRKSGLWELTMQMPQAGHKQTMQQCIDSATDDIRPRTNVATAAVVSPTISGPRRPIRSER